MEGRNQGSPATKLKKKKKTTTKKEAGKIEKKRKKKTQKDDGSVHVEGETHELRMEKLGNHHSEPLVLDDDRKWKKKKKKKNDAAVGQDSVRLDNGKNSVHVSDDDDMLFNFNTQPEVATFDHIKSLGTSHTKARNSESVLVEGEKPAPLTSNDKHEMVGTDRKKKEKTKKRRFDEDEQDALSLDDLSPKGCLQQNKKLHYVVPSQKQQHEEAKEMERPEVMGTPHNSKTPCVLSMRPTFSMAVAGSIVDNAQSLELATMLAGQIARAAAIFRVDEIVVFDDYDGANASNDLQEDKSEEVGGLFMVRILEYLEIPQYLRRTLIPMHRSLSSVGKLPPLDAPHHLRKHEWRPFREGVVLDKRPLSGSGSCVDVGLEKEVVVGQSLKPGVRVTVAMGQSKADGDVLQVVDREAARQAGFYWGYTVRYANCLSAVFDECPFEGKYDYCIGTSEHGEKIRSTELVIPKCKHLLVAFGGLSGLEESLELDKKLKKRSITNVFNRYLNTCPDQGSRTIRTEEAILISLQFLQAAVQEALHTP